MDQIMNDISNTALVTLKCHVQDAEQIESILEDNSSLKTYEYLNTILDENGKSILQKKVKSNLVSHTALRAKKFDGYVTAFLQKFPTASIVNIGCGLDHRFERVDNGTCMFYDLDLPDIIELKKRIFTETH